MTNHVESARIAAMRADQKIYVAVMVAAVLVATGAMYLLVRWSGSAPGLTRAAQIGFMLVICANFLLLAMAWRALHGNRTLLEGPMSLVFKLMTASALLLAFLPRILAALTR